MPKKKYLEEQKIVSQNPEAIAYRNMRRWKVDKLFSIRDSKKDKKEKSKFDYLARQLWRKIIKDSNIL